MLHPRSRMPAKIPTVGWSSGGIALANLLEVDILTTVEGNQLAIHAMPMRDKFRRLLGTLSEPRVYGHTASGRPIADAEVEALPPRPRQAKTSTSCSRGARSGAVARSAPHRRVSSRCGSLITRLKNATPQSPLAAALGEYGRIVRTNFLLTYCADPAQRARIAGQLNKSETLHARRVQHRVGARALVLSRRVDSLRRWRRCSVRSGAGISRYLPTACRASATPERRGWPTAVSQCCWCRGGVTALTSEGSWGRVVPLAGRKWFLRSNITQIRRAAGAVWR